MLIICWTIQLFSGFFTGCNYGHAMAEETFESCLLASTCMPEWACMRNGTRFFRIHLLSFIKPIIELLIYVWTLLWQRGRIECEVVPQHCLFDIWLDLFCINIRANNVGSISCPTELAQHRLNGCLLHGPGCCVTDANLSNDSTCCIFGKKKWYGQQVLIMTCCICNDGMIKPRIECIASFLAACPELHSCGKLRLTVPVLANAIFNRGCMGMLWQHVFFAVIVVSDGVLEQSCQF